MSRKKVILSIVLVILIVMAGIVFYLGVFYNRNREGVIIPEERLKVLYDNSYKYYLLREGDISKISGDEGYSLDGKSYDVIDGFKGMEDIDRLINDTFIPIYRERFYKELFSSREFMEMDGKLYYDNSDRVFCDTVHISYDSLVVTKGEGDGKANIRAGDVMIGAYFDGDDWYLSGPLFSCNADIGEE